MSAALAALLRPFPNVYAINIYIYIYTRRLRWYSDDAFVCSMFFPAIWRCRFSLRDRKNRVVAAVTFRNHVNDHKFLIITNIYRHIYIYIYIYIYILIYIYIYIYIYILWFIRNTPFMFVLYIKQSTTYLHNFGIHMPD